MNGDPIKDDLDRATRLFQEGRLEDAAAVCRAVLETSRADAQALHVLGLVEMKQGSARAAVEILVRAVNLSPMDPVVHSNLAQALRAAGEGAQAEHHLRYALHLDRTFAAAHYNLGFVLWDKGDNEGAEMSFRNALVIDARFASALTALGRLLLQEERAAEAIGPLSQATQVDHADVGAKLALGQALWATGRTREARATYGEAAFRHPEEGQAHYQRARASFELCDEGAALEELGSAFEIGCLPAGVISPRPVAGRLAMTERWCDPDELVRVARPQWHNVSSRPRVILAEGGNGTIDPPQSFTSDITVGRCADCSVLPHELLVMNRQGELIVDGVVSRPRDRPYTSRYVIHFSDDGRVLMAIPGRTDYLDQEAVLLGAASSHYEWTFECLARLWILRQRPALESLPLLVQSDLSHTQREMLALLGYTDDRLVQVPDDATLQCRSLHIPSLVSVGHFIAPAAVEHLRRELHGAVPVDPGLPRRVYLSREGAGTRRLANERELRSILLGNGFAIIHPQEHSARQLLSLLAGAEVVLGVEGFAMSFVFFAPRRAKVGFIAAEGTLSTRYLGPSATLGHQVSYLPGAPEFGSSSSLSECDLSLSPDVLERFIRELDA